MKKMSAFVVALFFAVLLVSSFVSAQGGEANSAILEGEVNKFIGNVNTVLKPVLELLLGKSTTGQDFTASDLTIKLLVFVLLLAVVYMAVSKLPGIKEESWVLWTISLVASILSVRFLTSSALVELVWLPTGVLGVSFMCLFPLVLYFFFVESFESSRMLRRFGWVFFIVIYVTLAIVRWNELKHTLAGGGSWNLGWIYIMTAGLGVISLLFDRTIQNAFQKVRAENAHSIAQNNFRIDLTDEFNKLRQNYLSSGSTITKVAYNAHITNLENRAKTAGLPDLEALFKAAKVP